MFSGGMHILSAKPTKWWKWKGNKLPIEKFSGPKLKEPSLILSKIYGFPIKSAFKTKTNDCVYEHRYGPIRNTCNINKFGIEKLLLIPRRYILISTTLALLPLIIYAIFSAPSIILSEY